MNKVFLCAFLLLYGLTVFSQDSSRTKLMDSVVVNAYLQQEGHLPDVSGASIYAGKHTNNINMAGNYNGLAQNLGRTAFAKIPGLTMWEMDGAGTQLNIGTRGTDPHRSIEMNMRQNGYNTNSDIFGYPENHYTVPLQAIQSVQLVRGSAALQFGPQFGGMMNYELKKGDSLKPISIESEQTTGSNNFFNSFNAVGGTKGRFNYYAFADFRHGDGWRDNARFNYQSYYADLNYQASSRTTIGIQFSRMTYVQQIAGGLTDAQFNQNPQQSARSRNYFQPVITIPALLLKSRLGDHTKLEITTNGVFGERNSVQFINAGNIPDTFNTSLGRYNPRQVDRDYYSGITTEARILHEYKTGKTTSILSGGARFFSELTKRRQKGTGTSGSDFDLSLTQPYGIDLRLKTHNYAVFAENKFQLTPNFSFTPGIRFEIINTSLHGVINNATSAVSYTAKRNFPLAGAGLQYQLNKTMQLYGNISQAYRPYLYANVTPADRLDKIDPKLQDSKGYDIDLGYRGFYKNIITFDFNAFYLFYGNKIGLLAQGGHLLTTNIGNSVAKGFEAFAEVSLWHLFGGARKGTDISWYHSLAFTKAKYTSGSLNFSGVNTSVEGNYVENAPVWNYKTGMELSVKKFSSSVQYSFTSKSYNDAFNSIASANGVLGEIPAYHVWDWSCRWDFQGKYHVGATVNNFTNEKYFNRRITFYPGPGILPADGRTFTVSFGVKL